MIPGCLGSTWAKCSGTWRVTVMSLLIVCSERTIERLPSATIRLALCTLKTYLSGLSPIANTSGVAVRRSRQTGHGLTEGGTVTCSAGAEWESYIAILGTHVTVHVIIVTMLALKIGPAGAGDGKGWRNIRLYARYFKY